jgi:hypothetical protein
VTGPVGLAAATDPGRYGNKAAGLARVLARVPVPDGVVVPGQWLYECLDLPTRSRLVELLGSPKQQVGWLAGELAALLGTARWDERQTGLLRAAVRERRLGASLAVRSSSADEDDAALSFAGVFDSLIGVAEDDVAGAVRRVWLSGFGAQALSQYRRIGRLPEPGHLSVLVQRAIDPRLAGVAFNDPSGDAYLEWVAGHGAGLVGGLAVPVRERLDRTGTAAGWRGQLRAALIELAADGCRHDVEWAWDGNQLWIVQVRPATAEVGSVLVAAGLRVAPLYEGDAHDLLLGDCAEDYTRIRAKRRLPRAIALSRGANVPRGWLVNWDPASPADALLAWSSELPPRLILDAGRTERQHIIGRAELAGTVGRLAGTVGRLAGSSELAFLCREYLHGEIALLSTVAADGSVYVEASDEGLLALNRGFGSARPIEADRLDLLVGPDQARALAATTREHARQLHPRAVLEWVVSAGRLVFVDYSAPVEGSVATGDQSGSLAAQVLSTGLARGWVQHLSIDETLTESSTAPFISIAQPVSAADEAMLLGQLRTRLRLQSAEAKQGPGVIVAAARPIAVLSMLIGLVEGFLFEEGAKLCHLGILLREAGVPAAIVGTGNLPADGSYVELVHGTVTRPAGPAG